MEKGKNEESVKYNVFTTDKKENIKLREEFAKTRIGKEVIGMDRLGWIAIVICLALTIFFEDEYNLWYSAIILVGYLYKILTRGLYLIMLNKYSESKQEEQK